MSILHLKSQNSCDMDESPVQGAGMNSLAQFVWDSLELRAPIMLRIVEPLSEDQIRWAPPNNNNSIAWLLWHIAEVEDNWVRDRVYGQPRRYPFGTPMREAALDRYPSKAALLEYFFEVRTISRQRLEQVSESDFDRLVDDPTWGGISVRQVWAGVVTSCAWHSGQIVLTNRLIPRDLRRAGDS